MNGTPMALGLIIVGMGVVTYAIRLSLILLLGRLKVPPLVQRALPFVPPAVLSALIFPELLLPGGTLGRWATRGCCRRTGGSGRLASKNALPDRRWWHCGCCKQCFHAEPVRPNRRTPASGLLA
jgi:hypothetical protein